jgi:DNA-binding NarL/FixJ family response regulator
MNTIRLVLFNDNALFRDSLSRQLAAEQDFEVVAATSDAAAGLQILTQSAVDVALLDLNLGGSSGAFDVISSATRGGYRGKFLLTASHTDRHSLLRALRIGVAGIFLIQDSLDNLLKAVRLVATGNAWLNPDAIGILTGSEPTQPEAPLFQAPLTSREEKVLAGILEGLRNKGIAERLDMTENSVKTVVRQLFRKAGVQSRSQLVRVALNR